MSTLPAKKQHLKPTYSSTVFWLEDGTYRCNPPQTIILFTGNFRCKHLQRQCCKQKVYELDYKNIIYDLSWDNSTLGYQ